MSDLLQSILGSTRRRLAVAGIAALVGGVLVAGPARAGSPAAGPGFVVGLSPGAGPIHDSTTQLKAMTSAMAKAGDRWIRLDVSWPDVEPEPGSFNWTAEDNAIRAARAAGLQVDAVIDYAPFWARTNGHPNARAYRSFVTAVVQRYAPLGVHTYEIWNEENLTSSWGGPVSAAAYGAVLEAGYRAVHRADPHGLVLLGGLARTTTGALALSEDPVQFLSDLYAAGYGRDFDAVAAHPYSYPDSPTSTDKDNGLNELPAMHTVMVAHGGGAKKIWVTEYGYSTGAQVTIGAVVMPTAESTQATYLQEAIKRVQAEPWAGPFFVFSWQDDMWQTFGLLRADGSAKPALTVFEHAPH